MPDDRYLGIYLNDHLAGATGGIELARRALSNNRGTSFEAPLERFVRDLEEERSTLENVMELLGMRKDPLKQAGAWALEKVGRLKLNGKLFAYSELSRVLELEALLLGARAKLAMWQTLERLSTKDARLRGVDVAANVTRSEKHIEQLDRRRREAAKLAFGS